MQTLYYFHTPTSATLLTGKNSSFYNKREMDYTLPALKLFISQLALATPSAGVMAIGGLRFQRAWLQGVIVTDPQQGHMVLDDGSGLLELVLLKDQEERTWKTGMYVLVIGAYATNNGVPLVKVHKIVDLSSSPQREALWNLEVLEAHKLFYSDQISMS